MMAALAFALSGGVFAWCGKSNGHRVVAAGSYYLTTM
jgi:hypothetical protein